MIHWHEGLFLQPHHLQSLQRGVYKAAYGERRFSMAFPYGVIEARLAVDDLEEDTPAAVLEDTEDDLICTPVELDDEPDDRPLPVILIARNPDFTILINVPLVSAEYCHVPTPVDQLYCGYCVLN